ncbi:MAG TPA: prepilin-type N-terminal cleavage/methylation domain-containing protein [Verrucomicrobiae bacterium]|jgi:type IV pilus assembly protein PilA|nr:prepilin-type N-terminal cleavage/methylation domain-containing protein [Verrucomicrobiae bacterium]
MKKQNGFSLIELLIVVTIILIIAAIAIPSLIRSKIAANEASAVASLRVINTAEVTYFSAYGLGYGDLINLSTPAAGCPAPTSLAACLLDANLSAGTKSGYTYTTVAAGGAGTTASPNSLFNSTAVPVVPGQSGQDSYCSDGSGVIRRDITGAVQPACSTSGLPPI